MRIRHFRAQYRSVCASPDGVLTGRTLQNALSQALSSASEGKVIGAKSEYRVFSDSLKDHTLVLNNFRDVEGCLFCEIVRYENLTEVPFILTSGGQQVFDFKRYSAEPGESLIGGFSYFLVDKDNIVIIEDEVSIKQCEDYLNWLLGIKTETCDKKISLQFNRGVPLKMKTVDQIRITDRIKHGDGQLSIDLEDNSKSKKSREFSFFDVIGRAFTNNDDLNNLLLRADADVSIVVKFKDKGRKKQIDSNFIDAVTRHIPDQFISLQGPLSRRVQGEIQSIGTIIDVEYDGKFASLGDIQAKLWRALQEFRVNGSV
jgi:hypothetical protein